MVKARKQTKVITALAPSSPADVPVVPATVEETVPENVPETVPGSPSSSEQPDSSRPVRVYADGIVLTDFADERLYLRSSLALLCTGIFDLFHFGHAKALEQAKKM